MPQDYIIRPIISSDFAQFENVFAETVSTQFPEYDEKITNYFIHKVFPSQANIEKFRIGVFDRETLIGYLIAEHPLGGIVSVIWLSIRDAYQRKGLGKKLLLSLEEYALSHGAHAIHLQSDERNLEFYQKCSYEILGFDKQGYFGTDNYLLKKQIAQPNIDNMI